MKNSSQLFWDRVARRSTQASPELRGTTRQIVDATQPYLAHEKRVLDYGCGTGELTIAIAEHVQIVHAIDTSPGMIEVATRSASQHGVTNVQFTHSSIDDLAPLAKTFDVVTAFNVLHYVDEPQKVFRIIHDSLAPGGIFISSTACLGEKVTFLGTLVRVMTMARIMPKTNFFRTTDLAQLITSAEFTMVATRKLSTLPDYFIVARKR